MGNFKQASLQVVLLALPKGRTHLQNNIANTTSYCLSCQNANWAEDFGGGALCQISSKLKKCLRYDTTLPIFIIHWKLSSMNLRQKVTVGEVSSQLANRKSREPTGSSQSSAVS